MGFTSYEVDNDKKFQAALTDALKQVSDLRIPLKLISMDFYKSQRAIFKLKSPGRYPDLGGLKPGDKAEGSTKTNQERAKAAKMKRAGFLYPLLVGASERIKKSTTDPKHPEAINEILQKKTLLIGTQVPYAIYHQNDGTRKILPLRKFLFIGPEASKFATSQQVGRLDRWLRIIDEYMNQVTSPIGESS